MLRAGSALMALLVIVALLSSLAAPASAARGHHCPADLPHGFPGLGSLRTTGVGCREARSVARWIWTQIHRQSWKGETIELPREVGPIRRRIFSCGYHSVEKGGNFMFYAVRCSAGRTVVRMHLSS